MMLQGRNANGKVEGMRVGHCALVGNQTYLARGHIIGDVTVGDKFEVVIDGQQFEAYCTHVPPQFKAKAGTGPSERIHVLSTSTQPVQLASRSSMLKVNERAGAFLSEPAVVVITEERAAIDDNGKDKGKWFLHRDSHLSV